MPITSRFGIGHRLIWTRSLWMRLAPFSVLGAAMVLLTAPTDAIELRQAAQIQFMHAMGTFACATFMNIGANRAKHAPLCFITWSVLHCGPIYCACQRSSPAPTNSYTRNGDSRLRLARYDRRRWQHRSNGRAALRRAKGSKDRLTASPCGGGEGNLGLAGLRRLAGVGAMIGAVLLNIPA